MRDRKTPLSKPAKNGMPNATLLNGHAEKRAKLDDISEQAFKLKVNIKLNCGYWNCFSKLDFLIIQAFPFKRATQRDLV